jgi:hypothetical protein
MTRLSPITRLFPAIAAAPFRVAPENAQDLQTEIDARNITLEFVDDPAILAEYVVSKSIVRLGVPFLDSLWTASHLYIVAFHEYQAAQQKGERFFELGKIERVANAYVLYRHFLEAVAARQSTEWPVGGSRPIQYPFEHSDGYMANEMFLVAIAWIMHHEIAHARLDHEEASAVSKLQESDADRAATMWVCLGEPEQLPLYKRAMGMVTAVVYLLALDLRMGRFTSNTHPPSFERLMKNLETTGLAENDFVFAFAFVLVDIQIAAEKVQGDIDREGSFQDMCASACLLLHGLSRVEI